MRMSNHSLDSAAARDDDDASDNRNFKTCTAPVKSSIDQSINHLLLKIYSKERE